MPGNALPAGVKLLPGSYGQWAGPDPSNRTNTLDVWGTGDDGKLYHWWLRNDTNEWYGWERFG